MRAPNDSGASEREREPMKEKHPAVLSDDAILDLYWQRDESAIRETDRKYRGYLHTLAWSILADSEDCEECLNDTYLRTWNAIPPARPQFLQAFLAKITRRIALDRRRAEARGKRVPATATDTLSELADSLSSGETVESAYESAVIAAIINRYLRTLSERDLDIFISRYFHADSVSGIARRVGLSVSGVRKALEKMRGELRVHLEREGIWL